MPSNGRKAGSLIGRHWAFLAKLAERLLCRSQIVLPVSGFFLE
jgi:hypothetical protein